MTQYINLYFDGGGVKAVTYAGAIETLVKSNFLDYDMVQRTAGCSAGAMAAFFLAIGYSVFEGEELILDMNFRDFVESNRYTISYAYNLYSKLGLCSGDPLVELFKKHIQIKTGNPEITFAQLHSLRMREVKQHGSSLFKDLYIIALNLQTQEPEIFSHEHPTLKDVPIATAVRASVSIPMIFYPVWINDTPYIDGAFAQPNHIGIFDRVKYFPDVFGDEKTLQHPTYNPHTLGFRIQQSPKKDAPKLKDLTSFSMCINLTIEKLQTKYQSMQNDQERYVSCDPLNISTIKFSLSKKDKLRLLESGRSAAKQFCGINLEKRQLDSNDSLLENIISKSQI